MCFTDLEGRLHMLDYDKKFLLKSADNLTFDGSSIRGFSQQAESDLRLGDRLAGLLLAAVRRLRPRQGAGVRRGAASATARPTVADMRAPAQELHRASCTRRTAPSATPPTRSRASSSRAATPSATTTRPASSSSSRTGGYYHSLPGDALRTFIDTRGRSAARDGLRQREGPPRGGAVAVRDELQLHRGARSPPTRSSSTSCSAARSPRSWT